MPGPLAACVAPTAQARARHNAAAIVRAVASPSRPLVMFIDDLQWAGRTPLGFLDLVFGEEPVAGLLLVRPREEARAGRSSLRDSIRLLRSHGMTTLTWERHRGHASSYDVVAQGFNYRLDELRAAMGLVQLGRLPGMVARRRDIVERYYALLAQLPVRPVRDPAHGTSNHQSFWVELPDDAPAVADVLAALAADGVSARRGIMAAHLEQAYQGHPHGPLPVTERLTSRTLILPLHHELTGADQRTVVDALARALSPGAARS